MLSYADMVTLLLALFIMLSTLGKDQTGLNFQRGLESLRQHQNWFGLPGMLAGTDRKIHLDAPLPKYPFEPTPDAEKGPPRRVLDAERERLQYFLEEMQRQFNVEKLPRITSQATLDLFGPLNGSAPHLTAKHLEVIRPLLPVLHRPDHRLLVIVWAAVPSEGPWRSSAMKAHAVGAQIEGLTRLDASARQRLFCVSQTWPHGDHQRPVLSLVVARVERPIALP